MVKRFTETVDIQAQNLSTGAAQGMSTLADRLESFKQAAGNIQTRIGTRRGQEEAAGVEIETTTVDGQEVAVAPEKRKATVTDILLFNGSQARSFNKTLRDGYLAEISNDNREAVSDIMARNPDNVTSFNDAMEGYVQGVLKGVEPALRPAVAAQLDNLTTDARIRVKAASQARLASEAEAAIGAALIGAQDAGIRAARDNNQVAAAEANLEYSSLVQSQVESGQITQAAADRMINDNLKTVAAENIISAVRREAQTDGGVERAAEALLNFRDAKLSGFTVEEQDAIYSTMVTELNGVLNLKNKMETAELETIEDVQKGNSADMYIGVLEGSIEPSDITLSLANKEINESQATKLINIINSRGAGVDDFSLINDITESIRNAENPEDIRNTIAQNTGGRLTSKRGLDLTALLNDSLDSESPLNTSNSKRAESFIVQSMRVTGPFGALDSEAEQRLANAKREYSEAVLAGEDPWVMADLLVDKDAITRAPNPMFGSKEDLQGSLEELNQAAIDGTIDKATYDFQEAQLKVLIDMQANLEAFEKARREALSGR